MKQFINDLTTLDTPVWAYPIIKQNKVSNDAIIPHAGLIRLGTTNKIHENQIIRHKTMNVQNHQLYFVPFRKNSDKELAWSKAKQKEKMIVKASKYECYQQILTELEQMILADSKDLAELIDIKAKTAALARSDFNIGISINSFIDDHLRSQTLDTAYRTFQRYMQHNKTSYDTLDEYIMRKTHDSNS